MRRHRFQPRHIALNAESLDRTYRAATVFRCRLCALQRASDTLIRLYQRDVCPFCSTCNRLRLTADGILRSCLFERGEARIREMIRSESHPAARYRAIADAMTQCVKLKPEVHSYYGNEQMSRIGG